MKDARRRSKQLVARSRSSRMDPNSTSFDPANLFNFVTFPNKSLVQDYEFDSEPLGNATVSKNVTAPMRHSVETMVLFVVTYSFVFLLGLIGNLLVVCVIFKCRRMCTVMNLFLLNLAVADLLVILLCLPCTLLSHIYLPWILGGVLCKAVAYVQGVSVSASVYSLVAVSFDRYLAIQYPLQPDLHLSKTKAKKVICGIWLVSSILSVPWLFVFQLVHEAGFDFCMEVWPTPGVGQLYFLIVNLVVDYVFPCILIIYFYTVIWIRVLRREIPECVTMTTRNVANSMSSTSLSSTRVVTVDHIRKLHHKTKLSVLRMLTVVISVFLVSWLPLYVLFTWLKCVGETRKMSESEENLLTFAMPLAQWLGSSNSCINPIIYNFLDKRFREGFKQVFTFFSKEAKSPSATLDKKIHSPSIFNHSAVAESKLHRVVVEL